MTKIEAFQRWPASEMICLYGALVWSFNQDYFFIFLGGTLAHAFFPFRGEAHFDMSERWTLSGLKGHNLFLVMAHEIGHTLGLVHSPVRHALMSPYYKKMGSTALLSWHDITAIQQLYGKQAVLFLLESCASVGFAILSFSSKE